MTRESKNPRDVPTSSGLHPEGGGCTKGEGKKGGGVIVVNPEGKKETGAHLSTHLTLKSEDAR